MNKFNILKNKKGVALVYTAFFMTVAIGFAALAIDAAYAYAVSNELKSVADAGALTAAGSFLTELRQSMAPGERLDADQIRNRTEATTRAVIQKSRILSRYPDLKIDIAFGTYNTLIPTPYDEKNSELHFTLLGELGDLRRATAFRVTVSRASVGMIQRSFLNVLGVLVGESTPIFNLTRNSVAMLTPRNFMLVIDTTGSMDDVTYQRPVGSSVRLPNDVWPSGESFIVRPYTTEDPENLFSILAPSVNSSLPPEDRVYPEPLQTVLNTSLRFLNDLTHGALVLLGDFAGIYYFSTQAVSKLRPAHLIPVTPENINDVFNPLLSNAELYNNLVQRNDGATTLSNGTALPTHYRYGGGSTYNPLLEQYSGGPVNLLDGPVAIPWGNTNIGAAIAGAANSLTDFANTQAGRHVSIIILFTDGVPNCAPNDTGRVNCYGSDATPEELAKARRYTWEQAQNAMNANIRIYPIVFGNLDEDTQRLFTWIAQGSGLEEYFAIESTDATRDIAAALEEIFNQINLIVPFSLVG